LVFHSSTIAMMHGPINISNQLSLFNFIFNTQQPFNESQS